MKTIKEWLEELPDGYRERALENLNPNVASDLVYSIGDAISGAFIWDCSQEGEDFWSDVYYHYEAPPPPPLPPLP